MKKRSSGHLSEDRGIAFCQMEEGWVNNSIQSTTAYNLGFWKLARTLPEYENPSLSKSSMREVIIRMISSS